MTPTERAFKHGMLAASVNYANRPCGRDNPYREPELRRAWQRGVETVNPTRPVEYTMPPRGPEPAR